METVAVRIPGDPFLLALLCDHGLIVAAPSANIAGQPPISTAEEARRDFGDEVELFVDGGPPAQDRPSTLVRCISERAEVLREGPIALSLHDLET
jgi:tRNA A37 threonylcarbamoyladenosine synthetase subunit TsaC/SUA5/YrdC